MSAVSEAVCGQVYRRFPELKGAKPTVKRAGPDTVYTFSKSVPVQPGGPSIRLVVRVTVDADGRIVKTVSSK